MPRLNYFLFKNEGTYRSGGGGEGAAVYVTPDLSYSVLLLGGSSRVFN